MRSKVNYKKLASINLSGFGVVDTVISLSISCVMMVFILKLFISYQIYQKKNTTEHNIMQIKNAIIHYVKCNGVVPYPDKNGDGFQMDIPISSSCWNENYMHGLVPYKTIGISPEVALDGDKKRLKYSINPTFGERKAILNAAYNDIRVILSNKLAPYNNQYVYSNKDRDKDYIEYIAIPTPAYIKEGICPHRELFGPYTSHIYVRSEDICNPSDISDLLELQIYLDGQRINYTAYKSSGLSIDNNYLDEKHFINAAISLDKLHREKAAIGEPIEFLNIILFAIYNDNNNVKGNAVQLSKNNCNRVCVRSEIR